MMHIICIYVYYDYICTYYTILFKYAILYIIYMPISNKCIYRCLNSIIINPSVECTFIIKINWIQWHTAHIHIYILSNFYNNSIYNRRYSYEYTFSLFTIFLYNILLIKWHEIFSVSSPTQLWFFNWLIFILNFLGNSVWHYYAKLAVKWSELLKIVFDCI